MEVHVNTVNQFSVCRNIFPHTGIIRYSASQLYHYRLICKPRIRPPQAVLDILRDYGIYRSRGCRGQGARNRRTVKWRSLWDHNNGVHRELLRYFPTETRYDNNDHCSFGLINARSLRNKCEQFLHFVVTENLDFCIVVESWIKDSDTIEIASLKADGYNFVNVERKDRIGGGIGIFYKNNISVEVIDSGERSSFEFALFKIRIGSFVNDVAAIYRPPYSANHPITINTFLTEFSDYTSDLFLTSNRCMLLGDFNIRVNRVLEPGSEAFINLLNALSLNQLVSGPTHYLGILWT
ncbi:hypothetical protein BSL78_25357 [Apostichopus japonicus]|uniref:RNA-directed DNA polymerase from mobile element jockey-like n=1 Tax=Stichopus japonicus TaxID=307972 RepID=A0A2G8JPZ6_STIJA|nr:hypothetical protein BSL78_25357 [Apostichopus japonicus]